MAHNLNWTTLQKSSVFNILLQVIGDEFILIFLERLFQSMSTAPEKIYYAISV